MCEPPFGDSKQLGNVRTAFRRFEATRKCANRLSEIQSNKEMCEPPFGDSKQEQGKSGLLIRERAKGNLPIIILIKYIVPDDWEREKKKKKKKRKWLTTSMQARWVVIRLQISASFCRLKRTMLLTTSFVEHLMLYNTRYLSIYIYICIYVNLNWTSTG